MPRMNQQTKIMMSMAGEFGAASELMKRGFNATITYGNAKATDIVVFGCGSHAGSYKRIEVKTTRSTRVVTNFFQKYGNPTALHPDYWIIVYIDASNMSHYYILSHSDMGQIQMQRNKMTTWASCPKGCDNVLLSSLKQYKNNWSAI